nr:AraC family transcriptional regulator [Actinomadura roseirufa]
MDILADLLDGVRARGALVHQAVLSSPWSLRFAGGARLSLVAMVAGRGWVIPAGGAPLPLGPGDVAVLRGPAPHVVAEDPAVPPRQVIDRADYCARAARAAADGLTVGARTCAVSETGSAVLLSGAYESRTGISDRLLGALPDALTVPDGAGGRPLLGLVTAEVERDRQGQRAVLDRLLDLMLVSTLRAWFDGRDAGAPAWYRVRDDSLTGAALRLMHDDPSHPWTVEELAARIGVSRAALARRFTAEVGEPPITYLARWRMALAADLLRGTDATVGSIARRVGYAGTFAFSAAFKRHRGTTPTRYRADARLDAAAPQPPEVGVSTRTASTMEGTGPLLSPAVAGPGHAAALPYGPAQSAAGEAGRGDGR